MKKKVLRERRGEMPVITTYDPNKDIFEDMEEMKKRFEMKFNINEMSKAELLDIARKLNIKAQSKMSKADIIELINSNKED